MPDHESLISLILQKFFPTFWANLESATHSAGWPVNDTGHTWIAGSELSHQTGLGLQHVFHAILVLLVLTGFAFIARSKIKDTNEALIPEGKLSIRNFVELFVGTTHSMMADIMGEKNATRFLPLIGACAFFILFSNFLGLIPGFLPPTSNLNTTVVCSVIIFLATHYYGVKEHGLGYFKHFFGPIIKWYALPLMVLMFVIETISHFARPLSLSLRLMANMFADHMVLGVFLGLAPWLVPVPLMLLGTLVVVVQTLVFCILSTVYIAMALEHEDH